MDNKTDRINKRSLKLRSQLIVSSGQYEIANDDDDDHVSYLTVEDKSSSAGTGVEELEMTYQESAAVYVVNNNNNNNMKSNSSQNGSIGENSLASGSSASTRKTVHLSKQNSLPPKNDRKRVPGGAAAKLFRAELKSKDGAAAAPDNEPKIKVEVVNDESVEVENDIDYEAKNPIDTSEILDVMNKTRTIYEKGPESNRRYNANPNSIDEFGEESSDTELNDENKKRSTPTILNRKEVIPENAKASVSALLTPRFGSDCCSVYSAASGGAHSSDLHSVPSNPLRVNQTPASISAFQSPSYHDMCNASTNSGLDTSVREPFESSCPEGPTKEPILSEQTERRVDLMSQKMVDPSKTLAGLLKAIATPEDGTIMDRGYMVRRKNACGALQVLTAHARKRRTICWTLGVLPALTSVLQDGGDEGVSVAFTDLRTQQEYEEARKRAIASLMNLSMPAANRLAVFHTPGLIQAIIDVMLTDEGESLQGCCAVLAYLAKSVENRILMAQVPGLFEGVLHVLKPEPFEINETPSKKRYPWSSGSDSESDVSSVNDSVLSGSVSGEDEDDSIIDDGYSTAGNSYASGSISHGSTDSRSSCADGEELSTGSELTSGESAMSDEGKSEVSRMEAEYSISPTDENMGESTGKVSKEEMEMENNKKRSALYESNKFKSGARQNLFAMLGHLVKEKDNAFRLTRVPDLVPTIVEIAKFHDSPAHVLAVQFLAHLTRHRLNTKMIVFQLQTTVPVFVMSSCAINDTTRKYACFALLNLSRDKSCRHELTSNEKLVTSMCHRARMATDPEEKMAAVSVLKNLTDDPANLIPLSNAPECIATLMHIAHGKDEGITESMQFRACDALATLSHWFRKIATNGQTIDAIQRGSVTPVGLFVPSLQVVTHSQWQ